MKPTRLTQLISFLQLELAIPADWIALAHVTQGEQDPNLLPMILWQYRLATLSYLEQVFDGWKRYRTLR